MRKQNKPPNLAAEEARVLRGELAAVNDATLDRRIAQSTPGDRGKTLRPPKTPYLANQAVAKPPLTSVNAILRLTFAL
jgi:hypothetical protein